MKVLPSLTALAFCLASTLSMAATTASPAPATNKTSTEQAVKAPEKATANTQSNKKANTVKCNKDQVLKDGKCVAKGLK